MRIRIENLYRPCELEQLPVAKDFSDQNDGDINKDAFFEII